MILNVSGRTDIVAFYSEWFKNRYKEGFVDVRNPFYHKNVSRIFFKDVDMIVFCTKNPLPIIDFLPSIKIPIIFHITLTPYKNDIEPNVISKDKVIEGIKEISNILGKENVYVRYDPIFLSDKYNLDYHIKAFNKMCSLLKGYVSHIIVSFIDDYKNVRRNMNVLKLKDFTKEDYKRVGESFSKIASDNNMTVQTCAEEENLVEYGFIKSDCISKELAKRITNKDKFKTWKSRNNKCCKCVEMVDIGAYNTCSHFCKYCYANYDEKIVKTNKEKHNVNSSLLIGKLTSDDVIKVRKS